MKLIVFRAIYRIVMKLDFIRSLRGYFPLWSASRLIYIGPAGPAATIFPETVALKRVSAETAISDQELYRNLENPNANVAGYCLEALILRKSASLEILPASLKTRPEPVAMGFTSFVVYRPFSEYIAGRISAELHLDPKFR